jgi:anthranilate synthase component II
MRVLIVDNYDSFVYNLAQYIGENGDQVVVKRNDQINPEQARQLRPDKVVISPGPGTPADPRSFGSSASIIRTLGSDTPTLGVCLGYQGIVYAFGGRIVRAGKLRHGKTSAIRHDEKGIFRGIPNPFNATRYHSLVAERRSLPDQLTITAESLDDHEIMGVRHKELPIEGVQFHPESILTSQGRQLIKNFLDE